MDRNLENREVVHATEHSQQSESQRVELAVTREHLIPEFAYVFANIA